MDPKAIRSYLKIASIVLAGASAIVAKLLEVDITSTTVVVGAVASVVAGLFAKASEAPGGVPKWKIPSDMHKYIQK